MESSEYVPFYQVETVKPYDDVLTELQLAIAENNFRITGHSRVGKVIRERGAKDFPDYDTIQFCNLTYAKTILDINPKAIRFMPCNVITYKNQGKTSVRINLLPTKTDNKQFDRFAVDINKILKDIVDFSVEQ
jgi:Uncharacterized conserved protein